MLRTAICFFGFLRNYQLSLPSYIEHMVQPFNTDIFMFCPMQQNAEECIKDIFKDKLIYYELFDHNIDYFKSIVSLNNIPQTQRIGGWEGQTYKSFSMFYQIKRSINLMHRYEEDNNFRYNIVFLIRPDAKILKPVNVNFDFTNAIYSDERHKSIVWNSKPQLTASDHLLMSNSNNISKLKDIYDVIPSYHKEGILINNETLIGFHLFKNNIKFVFNPFTDHWIM
jgi:hypothetical protein